MPEDSTTAQGTEPGPGTEPRPAPAAQDDVERGPAAAIQSAETLSDATQNQPAANRPEPPPGLGWDQFPGYGQAPPNWPGPPGWPQAQQSAPTAPSLPQLPATQGPYVAPGQPLVPGQPIAPGQPLAYGPPAGYGQPGMPGQYGASELSGTYGYPVTAQYPEPARPKRKLPRWLLFGIPALVVVVVATVLVVMNIGNSVNPAVSKANCDPRNLPTCLIAAPAGAGKNASTWAQSTSVTSAAYGTAYTDPASVQQPDQVGSQLSTDGLKDIAHQSWYQGSNQIDIILLSFGSPQGAQAWAADRTGTFLALDNGPQFSVPGDPVAKAYSTSSPNSAGDIDVRYVTTVGSMDLEVHYASQGTLQQHDFDLWAGTEYSSLQAAAAVTPAPSPTATTFQAATCPDALTACLMPFPAGSSQLSDSPSTYTISSYVSSFITTASASSVTQRMQSDSVTKIDSEAWGVGTTGIGQVVLIQTRTDAEAQDLMTNIGGVVGFTGSFSIPGYSSATGTNATSADAQGFYNGLVTAQVGTVYLELFGDFTGSFDSATAQSWAVDELNLLTRDTQSHWGFPIPQVTTPSLPAFAAGSCATTTLTDCMMAVPSGATAQTSGGGPAARGIGISGFVGAVYADRQNYEETWLNNDGAKDAASESWTASDGATATDYVMSFAANRQAAAAARRQAGDSMPGTQSCSVPTLPNLYCMVLPQDDSTGAVPIRITAWSGRYELDLEFTQTDSADTADALSWAQAQLQLLAGG